MDEIILSVKNKTARGTVILPASKSISNRLLIINALSGKQVKINNLSNANDTAILHSIISNLKFEIDSHDAGTVMRFLTAYCAITPGKWVLKGTERMHSRPIGILVEKLKELGADIIYTEKEGYPPLKITGKPLKGGTITIDSSVSSQYISGLMMIAPCLIGGLIIQLQGKIASLPYITMTAGLIKQCGARAEINDNIITITEGNYTAGEIIVENDWSAASYWYAFAAMCKNAEINLPGLYANSLQGDSIVAEWMQEFGTDTKYTSTGIFLTQTEPTLTFFEKDFTHCPDLAPTFIALCGALGIPAHFYGLESLAIKESDRTAALATELEKLNIIFWQKENYWELIPNPGIKKITGTPVFSSHNDHRIAMALCIFTFVLPEIKIQNPGVVKKSYPTFWEDFERSFVS